MKPELAAFDPALLRHATLAVRPDGEAGVLSAADFDAAAAEIAAWDGYAPTPLRRLDALAAEVGLGSILVKEEAGRFGLGSFKALGAAYAAARVLQRELSARLGRDVALAEIRSGALAGAAAGVTLVSATDGNHGRSLAWGARMFGARCRIYIHAEVSPGREAAIRAYGAEVIRIAGDYDASVRLARDEAAANGWFVVSDTSWDGYTQPPTDVMAGYGLMVREIAADLDGAPSHIFLQGGVGGLAAAVAAAARLEWGPGPRIVVVEPDRAACLYASARAGRPVTIPIAEETIMAGLSCGEPSPLAWAVLEREAADFLTVPDAMVGPAMRLLARPLPGDPAVTAGESAVPGLAAILAACRDAGLRGALDLGAGARPLVIASEGITDPEIYDRILAGRDAA